MTNHESILTRHDAGASIADIAAAEGMSTRRVYQVLAEHRPDRPRKARERTSSVPDTVRGLAAQGWKVPRIAAVLGISRAYIYRALSSNGQDAGL